MIIFNHQGHHDHDHEHEHEHDHVHTHTHDGSTHTHTHTHEHEHDHEHTHGENNLHDSSKEMKTLAALISHWVHHGEDHMESYKEWADKAMAHGREDVADELNEAISLLGNANEAFTRALELMKNAK